MRILPKIRTRAGQTARKFASDRRGNVLVTFAFSTVVLLGFMGLSTDSALGFLVNSRMSKALDAAGLAAGRSALSADLTQEARNFFDANFPDAFLSSSVTSFTVTPDANNEFITLTASATMPTRFMRLFGINEVDVSARTVVHRQTRGMELALVMDNTGSMRSGGKMDAMKDAAQDLVDILYAGNETLPNFWVSLVPYTATVNIGNAHTAWLDGGDQYFDVPSPFDPTVWKGCVEARAAPLDQDDTPPNLAPFTSFLYEADVDNVWPAVDEANDAKNNGTGPNLGCGPAITPLVADKTTVTAAIAEMLPWHRGGTTGNLGLIWGWRVLSPSWQGLWGDPSSPLAYDTPLIDKVVVILTDGQNQFYDWPSHGPTGTGPDGSDYTAYGRLGEFGFATLDDGREEIDQRFSNICEAMKLEGILLYTITFGSTPNTDTQTLYRNCASDPLNYFHAPNNATLETAFHAIAEQLSNLRIAE